MSDNKQKIMIIGGSHSVHVKIPARILKDAGYSVILGDLQLKTDEDAYAVFDEIYNLNDRFIHSILSLRSICPTTEPTAQNGPMKIEKKLNFKSYYWNLLQNNIRAYHLYKLVKKVRPEILYFQSMTAGGQIAYYLLKKMNWPNKENRPGILTHLWGYRPRYHNDMLREIKALQYFDHLHSSSPAVANMYEENYKVPENKLSVFARGINTEIFAPKSEEYLSRAAKLWGVDQDKFVIIHNRHLHPMYRVDIAVDAFIELVKRGNDVFLLLVRGSMCDSRYEKELIAKLNENDCADRYSLLPGVIDANEMATALQLCDCAVNCVPFDALGVSILEAMYCKAIPVVRNLESYEDFIINGKTAFAVGSAPGEYVDSIEKIINDKSLAEKLSQAGFDLVSRNGTEKIFAEKTLKLISECSRQW